MLGFASSRSLSDVFPCNYPGNISIFAYVNALVPFSARITITSEALVLCAFPQLLAIARCCAGEHGSVCRPAGQATATPILDVGAGTFLFGIQQAFETVWQN